MTSCNEKADNTNQQSSTTSEKTQESQTGKPVQHLKLPNITSEEKAVEVMRSTTDKLKGKAKLDATELGEIHIITYSLEKAIAYFAENTTGDQQATAKKMAEVCEKVHLNSENNRAEKTKAALDEFFKLEETFSKGL